jgi:hypothetical protein
MDKTVTENYDERTRQSLQSRTHPEVQQTESFGPATHTATKKMNTSQKAFPKMLKMPGRQSTL